MLIKNKLLLLIIVITTIIGISILYYISSLQTANSQKIENLAKCLKNNKAIFYGAFWCPHCQSQKKIFGKFANELPYVECSTSDGEGQLGICSLAKIESYPTWVFADGTSLSGQQSFAILAQKSNCPNPAQ